MPVTVVLPCRNEARNLELLLPRLPSWIDEVVVVDSGCTDDTVAVAQALVPDVVIATATAPGKGAALVAGFAAASGGYLVAMDADGSNDPDELRSFIDGLESGADLVKGSRYLPGGGSDDATRLRDFGNTVLRGTFNRVHRAELTDLCYGYVAFRAPLVDVLFGGADGFDVEAVLQANACRAGLDIREVPSFEAGRVYGSSNLRPVRDGARILGAIVRTRPGARRPVAVSA